MARPSKSTDRAPGQRTRLPRNRQSFRLDLRLEKYEKLLRLAAVGEDGRPEPLVSVVERLIEAAELPRIR